MDLDGRLGQSTFLLNQETKSLNFGAFFYRMISPVTKISISITTKFLLLLIFIFYILPKLTWMHPIEQGNYLKKKFVGELSIFSWIYLELSILLSLKFEYWHCHSFIQSIKEYTFTLSLVNWDITLCMNQCCYICSVLL